MYDRIPASISFIRHLNRLHERVLRKYPAYPSFVQKSAKKLCSTSRSNMALRPHVSRVSPCEEYGFSRWLAYIAGLVWLAMAIRGFIL